MRGVINFFTASIQRKLFFSFAIVIVLVLAMVVVWYYQLAQVRAISEQVVPSTVQIDALQEFGLTISAIDADLERFFVIGGAQYKDSVVEDVANMIATLEVIKDNATAAGAEQEALATLDQSTRALDSQISGLLGPEAANLSSRDINQQIIAVYSQIDGVKEAHQNFSAAVLAELQGNAQEQASIISGVLLQILVIGVVVTVLVTVILLGVTRSIATPLSALAHTAVQIARGDLEAAMPDIKQKDEVGQLATAFENMTGQLRNLIASLEERVTARTQRLEIVATLSEQLVAILNVDQLLTELVNQVKDRFDYYHAHVYLINPETRSLVMRAGAGEAGLQMKAQGHSIPVDAQTSLVARAARTGEIVGVDNVREAADWLPNPFLPDTYSEMAVPIVLEGQVVGVLDVQQDKVGGLDESDASVLRSLANQVAVAIRNARLFREVETALAQVRAAQERYLEQSWDKTKVTPRASQYLYAQPTASPLDENRQQVLAKAQQTAAGQHQPVMVAVDNGTDGVSVVAPVILREKAIGALQLHTTHKEHIWTEDDLTVLAAIADQFAQTAENLRLFDQTRNRAGREQTIREITDKLRAAPNMERLAAIATEELSRRLSATHAKLNLGVRVQNEGADGESLNRETLRGKHNGS